MDYKIGHASEFSGADIESFKNIVLEAGEVNAKFFDGLIQKDPILLFVPSPINIKAVGALKIPNESHKNKVFKNANSESEPIEYDFELGWIVSKKKGLGNFTTEILSEYKTKIYATVRNDNNIMLHILEKYGFKQNGNPFQSDRGDYQIVLLTKE